MKKDALLIAPVVSDVIAHSNFAAPNLGLHRIKAYLEKEGFTVDLYDSLIDEKNIEWYLEQNQYRLIGFSLIHDSLSSGSLCLSQSLEAIHIAKRIQSDAYLLAGGPEAMEGFDTVFRYTPADAVCLGEGEDVIRLLLKYNFELVANIPGLLTRTHADEMTNLKLWKYYNAVDWKCLNYSAYWKKTKKLYQEPDERMINVVRLIHMTHCARDCVFCSVSSVNKFAYGKLTKPAILNVEQIMTLINRIQRNIPDVRGIYFCGDDFFYNKKIGTDFLKKYIKSGLELDLLIQTYSSHLDYETVKLLKQSHCRHITCGIENASERIRQGLGKLQDAQRIENIVDWCREFGITCYYLLILFCPECTIEDLKENIEAVRKWTNKGAQVSIEPYMMPYKSARMINEPYSMDYGFIQVNEQLIKQPYIVYPADWKVREIMRQFKEKWSQYKKEQMKIIGHEHSFKGTTGIMMITLLEKIINENT